MVKRPGLELAPILIPRQRKKRSGGSKVNTKESKVTLLNPSHMAMSAPIPCKLYPYSASRTLALPANLTESPTFLTRACSYRSPKATYRDRSPYPSNPNADPLFELTPIFYPFNHTETERLGLKEAILTMPGMTCLFLANRGIVL